MAAAAPPSADSGLAFDFFAEDTTLAGAASPGTDYFSDAVEVLEFYRLQLLVLVSAVTESATVTMMVQASMDLTQWRDHVISFSPSVGDVVEEVREGLARFVRLKVTVVGANWTATLRARGVARYQ